MSLFIPRGGGGRGRSPSSGQDGWPGQGVAACDSRWCRHSRHWHLLPGRSVGRLGSPLHATRGLGQGKGNPLVEDPELGPPVLLLDTLLDCLIYARVIVGLNAFAQCPDGARGVRLGRGSRRYDTPVKCEACPELSS